MGFTTPWGTRIRRSQNPNAALSELDEVGLTYAEPTNGSLDQPDVFLDFLLAKSKSNDNRFTALGIVGTAGSGKTTICQTMFNRPEVKKHFLPRIWVCMTQQPDDGQLSKFTIAKRMLTRLGEDEKTIEKKCKEEDISGLVSLLHGHLLGKRYLIVLDDAWDGDEWYHKLDLSFDYSIQHSTDWSQGLALGLPKGYGGAVIVNGRSDKLVEMMVGKQNLHHLRLADEDCWAIFKSATASDPERDPEVEALRRFVVQGGGGHPIMAKLMGQAYRDMRQQDRDIARQVAGNDNGSNVEGSVNQSAKSSNGSSKGQVTTQESAQATTSQSANDSNGR